MTDKTPRPQRREVPVLEDIVERDSQRPPNHDLFAPGDSIDPAALRLALQEQLNTWLNAVFPDILANLEREARTVMLQRLADDLPDLLDRTLHKLQHKSPR